jgi:hypothetical protein
MVLAERRQDSEAQAEVEVKVEEQVFPCFVVSSFVAGASNHQRGDRDATTSDLGKSSAEPGFRDGATKARCPAFMAGSQVVVQDEPRRMSDLTWCRIGRTI